MDFHEVAMDKEQDKGSYLDFKATIKEDLRCLPNTWFLMFEYLNFPEFLVCVGGKFLAIKIKSLAEEERVSEITGDIREAKGLVFEVSKGIWPSVYKTIEGLSDRSSSLNN